MSFGCLRLPRLNVEIGEFIYHKAVAMEGKSIWPNKCLRSYFSEIRLRVGGTAARKGTSG